MSILKLKTFLQRSSGFTLLETLIAVAIMAVTFGAILMVQSGSLSAQEKSRQLTIVSLLAKTAMVDAEIYVEAKSFEEVKETDEGVFDEPFDDFKWKREIKEVEFPNIAAGLLGGEQEDGVAQEEELIGKLVTNYLSKAIREIKVTITWQKGKGEQNYSLSTYWVNLNNEFSLSP